MRRLSLFIAATSVLALSACNRAPGDLALNDRLQNPLYAEYYYDDVVERMVQLQLNNDPSMEDEGMKAAADDVRRDGLKKSQAAVKIQNAGASGMFVPGKEFVQGEALLVNGVLYIGPQFLGTPGVDTHIYLSDALDPRDEGTFPSDKSHDLGSLKSPYGDQWYVATDIPPSEARSVVLWDESLKRIIGFAQLHTQ